MNLDSCFSCCILPLLKMFPVSMAIAIESLSSSLKASNPNLVWNLPMPFALFVCFHRVYLVPLLLFLVLCTQVKVPIIWSVCICATVVASGALHFQFDGNLCLVHGSDGIVWESNTAFVAFSLFYSRTPTSSICTCK